MSEMILDQVLDSYLQRVTVKAGNGLTRSMNLQLRSYPAIPEIIRRTVAWLLRAEQTFQFSGVAIRTMHLYWDLVKAHDDWGIDVPVMRRPNSVEVLIAIDELKEGDLENTTVWDHPAFAGPVAFERKALLPYHQFMAAMAIGRRIGLFGGYGKVVLDPSVRRAFQNALATVAAS